MKPNPKLAKFSTEDLWAEIKVRNRSEEEKEIKSKRVSSPRYGEIGVEDILVVCSHPHEDDTVNYSFHLLSGGKELDFYYDLEYDTFRDEVFSAFVPSWMAEAMENSYETDMTIEEGKEYFTRLGYKYLYRAKTEYCKNCGQTILTHNGCLICDGFGENNVRVF